MKAITVNENINFERGRSVKGSVGVGKENEALNRLEEGLFGNSGKTKIYEIKVNSLDDIKVTFSGKYRAFIEKDPTYGELIEWTFKYVKIHSFSLSDRISEGGSHSSRNYKYWTINKNSQGFFRDPDQIKLHSEWVLDISKSIVDSEELAKAAIEGIQSKFGYIWVFELVKREKL